MDILLIERMNSLPMDPLIQLLVEDYLQVNGLHLAQSFDEFYPNVIVDICHVVSRIGQTPKFGNIQLREESQLDRLKIHYM